MHSGDPKSLFTVTLKGVRVDTAPDQLGWGSGYGRGKSESPDVVSYV